MEGLFNKRVIADSFGSNLKIVQSGQTIQAVIDSITDAAADNLYNVMVPPGHEGEFFVKGAYIQVTFIGSETIKNTNPLVMNLNSGLSGALQVCTDSIGNQTSEWVYKLGEYFASVFPSLTVLYHLWNVSGAYNSVQTIQTGINGVRFLTFDGDGVGRIDRENFGDITDDLDIRVRIDASLRPVANMALVSWFGNAGSRSFYLRLNSAGSLSFFWTANGTDQIYLTSTAVISDAITDPLWVRVTIDVDNGAANAEVKFYTSTDDVNESKGVTTWDQLGDTMLVGATTSIYNDTASMLNVPLEIAGRKLAMKFTGDIYAVEIFGVIDGVIPLNSLAIDSWYKYSTTGFVIHGSPVLNIINCAINGGNFADFCSGTSQKFPNYDQIYTLVSLSHNEGGRTGVIWLTSIAALHAVVRDKLPISQIGYVLQNAEATTQLTHNEHAIRQGQLAGWAFNNNADVLNVFQEFYRREVTDYLLPSDPVHPNANGTQLYINIIASVLGI